MSFDASNTEVHVINEEASHPDAMVRVMPCGLEVIALDDGMLIPPIDFVDERDRLNEVTCERCRHPEREGAKVLRSVEVPA